MLRAGQTIESSRGTRVEILENSPERISFRRSLPPLTGGSEGKAHRHHETSETFELLEGEAMGWIDGSAFPMTVGEPLEIPLGASHANPYTTAGKTATITQTVTPRPRDVEVYFTSWLVWLEKGETDDRDEPSALQVAAIIREGGRAGTWSSKPAVALQRILLPVLGLIAHLKGVRAVSLPREKRTARVAG